VKHAGSSTKKYKRRSPIAKPKPSPPSAQMTITYPDGRSMVVDADKWREARMPPPRLSAYAKKRIEQRRREQLLRLNQGRAEIGLRPLRFDGDWLVHQ
jgi:hypothetical protein